MESIYKVTMGTIYYDPVTHKPKPQKWTAFYKTMDEVIKSIEGIEKYGGCVTYKITPIELDSVDKVVKAVCHICS